MSWLKLNFSPKKTKKRFAFPVRALAWDCFWNQNDSFVYFSFNRQIIVFKKRENFKKIKLKNNSFVVSIIDKLVMKIMFVLDAVRACCFCFKLLLNFDINYCGMPYALDELHVSLDYLQFIWNNCFQRKKKIMSNWIDFNSSARY